MHGKVSLWGIEFRVEGAWGRGQGQVARCGVQGAWFRMQDAGCRVQVGCKAS